MDQNSEHLRLLSTCHHVVAGLAALFACVPLIHVALGIALATGAFEPGSAGAEAPPKVLGIFFAAFGALLVLAGWLFAGLLAYAGLSLRQRRRYLFCLVMAALACVFFPFGTVLGVFTVIVLARPGVRELFH